MRKHESQSNDPSPFSNVNAMTYSNRGSARDCTHSHGCNRDQNNFHSHGAYNFSKNISYHHK